MNACKNCKHHRGLPLMAVHIGPAFGAQFPLCTHPARETPDLVYGTRPNYRPCGEARRDNDDCGFTGQMFAPTLRHRIITALFGEKASD